MRNPLDLGGQTVLVTGASSGIGRATAVLLSQLGARLVLVARNQERLGQTAAALEGSGHRSHSQDLSDLEALPSWFGRVVEFAGPLAGLVHCAGVTSILPLRSVTASHMDQILRVNFQAAAILTREFARKRMHQDRASAVLVASIAGLVGVAGRSVYGASKGALIAFARSAALELARSDVRLNCVAPAYVRTEMTKADLAALTPEQAAGLAAAQPLGIGEPEDVAHAIAFLLSSASRWITGTVLAVDGGYTAQ
jgi:NAD(P)-dependent dehydrogenase (short-subunit alcohol dehydrogenase family)